MVILMPSGQPAFLANFSSFDISSVPCHQGLDGLTVYSKRHTC